jgi:hypothetical protein
MDALPRIGIALSVPASAHAGCERRLKPRARSRHLIPCAFAVLLLALTGCARAPHGAGEGVRLAVSLRFNGPVNDTYHYYFLVRNAADPSGQNGPIPVILPPYLNGFATGLNAASAAFTDFVEYSRAQRQPTTSGFGLYHLPDGVNGDPNRNVFAARGEPEYTEAVAGGNTLRFELDLSRLQPASGEPDPNNGELPRYLQVNVVATTTTPTDPIVADPRKYVDAFGEQRLGSGSFNQYLTIDTGQNRLYESTTVAGDPSFEPEHDTYPSDLDPGVDLVYWSIRISGR